MICDRLATSDISRHLNLDDERRRSTLVRRSEAEQLDLVPSQAKNFRRMSSQRYRGECQQSRGHSELLYYRVWPVGDRRPLGSWRVSLIDPKLLDATDRVKSKDVNSNLR
jgi:hypothetical protein